MPRIHWDLSYFPKEVEACVNTHRDIILQLNIFLITYIFSFAAHFLARYGSYKYKSSLKFVNHEKLIQLQLRNTKVRIASQWTRDVIITWLSRRNDVATLAYSDVIMALSLRHMSTGIHRITALLLQWNGHVVMLTKFASLVALVVVIFTTS